jgi:hypothetical protein
MDYVVPLLIFAAAVAFPILWGLAFAGVWRWHLRMRAWFQRRC